jgi:hypothetical protein
MGRPPFRQHGFAMRLPGGGHAPMRSHLTRRRGDLPLIDPTDRLSASGRSTRQYNDTQSIVTWVRPSSRNTILTIIAISFATHGHFEAMLSQNFLIIVRAILRSTIRMMPFRQITL